MRSGLMPRKGITGHDEWVVTEALATALIALEQLPKQHQPRTRPGMACRDSFSQTHPQPSQRAHFIQRTSLNWYSEMIKMRAYVIVASLALSVIGKASGTVVDTGADAQRYCELLVEGSFHDYGEARSAGACEGMIETAMSFSPNLPPDVRACPPAQGSILESARVLLRYLDQNPDRLNVPGITLAFEAFRDAWPCQGDDAEPSGRSGSKPKKRVPKKTK